MWVRNDNGLVYVNLTSGTQIGVDGVGSAWRVETITNGNGTVVLRDGFTTQQDAQTALDAFMAEQGFEQIPNGS